MSTIITKGEKINGHSVIIAERASNGTVEKLTPEQETRMHEIRKFWLNYFFSCKNGEINKESAKIGIDWLYSLAGKGAPVIIYIDSPMGCQYAVPYLKAYTKVINELVGERSESKLAQVGAQVGDQVWAQVGAQVGDQVRDQVWAQVRAQVGAQVRDQVGAQVRDQVGAQVRDQVGAQVRAQVGAQVRAQVRDQVWAQVWAQVGDQVGAQVRDQVGAQVRAQVWAQVGAQVRDQVWAQVGAQEFSFESFAQIGTADYYWVPFYDFFTQIGVIDHKGFEQFKSILLSGIYDMIQLNGYCIVSSLPSKIVRNDSNRLHNPNGAAIEFKDGYKQFFINGRAIPEEIFNQAKTLTKAQFLSEKNSDYKGAWYEILGQVKMMNLLGAKEVDQKVITHRNGDLETVTLYKTKEKFEEIDNQPFAWVKMVCPSTGTQYLQGVEPNYKCALKAIASLSMFEPEEYSFDLRS